jgi:hypothetical protein
VVSQRDRQRIRRAHRPYGAERLCYGCGQHYPCDCIRLLNDLEEVEAVARNSAELGRSVLQLEEKIRRAVRELT